MSLDGYKEGKVKTAHFKFSDSFYYFSQTKGFLEFVWNLQKQKKKKEIQI